jgi:hypothetical protein
MIDREILKKHNLKAVPFSCIGEGVDQWFYTEYIVYDDGPIVAFRRHLMNGEVLLSVDRNAYIVSSHTIPKLRDATVYVPVWRVTDRVS